VYAAVDKIARRVAQLNVMLQQTELKGEEVTKTRVMIHPFLRLFDSTNGFKPHEEFNVWELKYTIQTSLDMTGELWVLVERDAFGRPARVTPLPANRMSIVITKETGQVAGYFFVPKGCTRDSGGIFFPKRKWDYLHKNLSEPFIWYARYPSPRGIEDPRGWSPVKAAAYAYDINLFEQIYKRNFLQQGAQLGGILQSETSLSKDQIEEYIDQFKHRHSGFQNAGLPMVLPKMLKWTTTEPTPRDMQWAEAINMTQSQILQIFGISDAKLGRADIGNRNTADAMDVTFNREVIKSRLDLLTASLNADFLPVFPKQSEKLYFSVEFEDPVPADSEQNMKKEAQDLTMNVITRNEVRTQRGLKPMGKFGDQVYVPLTHIAVDPFDTKLELSQDDKELLGFIDPEEQAQIAADAKAKADKENAGKKKDGEVDPKASDQGKEDATEE
jgi:HK97 family phage portal protein